MAEFISLIACKVCSTAEMPAEATEMSTRGPVAAAISSRHRLWLSRHTTFGKRDGWRPRPRHRAASAKWIQYIDNQIRVGTHFVGLLAFVPNWALALWQDYNWKSWPSVGVAADQGPDGVCGVNCLLRKKEICLNMIPFWDGGHGACNDLDLTFKKNHLSAFVLMLMVVLNIPHGPITEVGLRYGQFQELLVFVFTHFTCNDCTLFQVYSTRMLHEMRGCVQGSGSEFDVQGGDVWARLWQFLKATAPFDKAEYKINFVRFMAFPRGLKELLGKWTLTLFKCELVALELDMLKGKAFKEQVMVKQSLLKEIGDVGDTDGTTASDAVGFDAKLLRSCCQSALVIGCMVFGVDKHKRMCHAMSAIAAPVDKWHGEGNAACRSVQGNVKWFVGQSNGGYMQHVKQIHEVLCNLEVLP